VCALAGKGERILSVSGVVDVSFVRMHLGFDRFGIY